MRHYLDSDKDNIGKQSYLGYWDPETFKPKGEGLLMDRISI